jgi:hypothetical protein
MEETFANCTPIKELTLEYIRDKKNSKKPQIIQFENGH